MQQENSSNQVKFSNKIKDLVSRFENQNKSLVELGFTDEKLNLRCLKKCDGDLKSAVDIIKSKFEKLQKRIEKRANRPTREERFEKASQAIKELGFEEQSKKLSELGFANIYRNARLLKKFSGNFEQILEKLQKKNHRQHSRSEEKRERDSKRTERKQRLLEVRAKKEKLVKVPTAEYEVIPENITTIYLDGNNMLFCENEIRKLVLSRKRLAAEQVLSNIAFNYAELTKRFNFVLVYDRTSFSLKNTINVDMNSFDYIVLSASPKYSTSDDALVDWAQGQGENAKNCLFVTSDRELQQRLSNSGVADIMKPGRWLKLVKAALGDEKYHSLLTSKSE